MANTKIPVELSSTPGIVDGSNATAITIDSSENVGIGTTSPFSKTQITETGWSSGAPYGTVLTVTGNDTNDANWGHLIITDSSTGTGNGGMLRFAVGSTSSDISPHAGIDGFTEGSNYGGLKFLTRANGGTATERLRIDSSGNVGIGTTSPDNTLHVDASGGGTIKLTRESVSTANFLRLECDGANGSIVSKQTTIFNNGDAERMRIDSDGKVTVDPAGNFADDNAGVLELRASAATGGWAISARSLVTTSSGTWFIGKQSNGTNVFSLVSDSDSIDLTFLSDERMKMNITDSADVLDKVKQITVKDFDWRTELNGDTKDNTRETKKYGFIAQNFQSIGLGQYVKELMPTDESDDTLGMDYGNITPILVKAIQEQQTLIETQQTIINDLKSRIETLEG
jgi:hypothetical protein